jgi:hypothetical protein
MQPQRYGPFPYIPINRRPRITWPNGARVALWVIPNIETFPPAPRRCVARDWERDHRALSRIERDVLSDVAAAASQPATGLGREFAQRAYERVRLLVRLHVAGPIDQRQFTNPGGRLDRRIVTPGSVVREGGFAWLEKTFA